MNYVLAVLTAFYGPDTKGVVLKARGRAISRAVDVAEIAKRRFLEGVKVGNIEIGREDMPVEGQVREITVNYTKIYTPTYNLISPFFKLRSN